MLARLVRLAKIKCLHLKMLLISCVFVRIVSAMLLMRHGVSRDVLPDRSVSSCKARSNLAASDGPTHDVPWCSIGFR